jgi:hypothetical protein
MSDELKLARIVKALAAFTLSLSTPLRASRSMTSS